MLLTIREFWDQAMEIREARWILTATGFLVVILVGFYLFKLVRDMALGSTSHRVVDSAEFLTDFQKLRDEGKLNEEEYARLKQSIPSDCDGGKDLPSAQEPSSGTPVNFLPLPDSESEKDLND